MTRREELTQREFSDAEKLCQYKKKISASEWPLLRTIFMAYMDGIGTGMQLSEQKEEEIGSKVH